MLPAWFPPPLLRFALAFLQSLVIPYKFQEYLFHFCHGPGALYLGVQGAASQSQAVLLEGLELGDLDTGLPRWHSGKESTCHWNFDGICIEPVDCFEWYGQFNMLIFPIHKPGIYFHLFVYYSIFLYQYLIVVSVEIFHFLGYFNSVYFILFDAIVIGLFSFFSFTGKHQCSPQLRQIMQSSFPHLEKSQRPAYLECDR